MMNTRQQSQLRIRQIRIALTLTSLIGIAGCRQGDQPDLGLVTGRITLNGDPLPNIELAFQPENGRASYGETDEDGYYELTYIRDTKGAKVGTHRVLVRTKSVDSDTIEPVKVVAGKNTIDIDCKRTKPKQAVQIKSD
jgi:hypothetical protein